MKTFTCFRHVALLGVTILVPFALSPTALWADDDHNNDRRYHDARHNDDHVWNTHEDQAYRMWAKENHRKYREFNRLNDRDRQLYWDWRHDHSDAQLKIDIR